MKSISPIVFLSLLFVWISSAHALTLFVQTPTAPGSPAMVVWTRDTNVDGLGELRFDLRFVSTGNSTTVSAAATTSASTTAPATAASPTPSPVDGQENSFVVQARADTSGAADGTDAGLALANIRLAAGATAGNSNVFFPSSGSYVVTAVSGPSNTPIGTSNSITVTDTPAAPVLSNAAPTPTTAPLLTTTTPPSPSSPSSSPSPSTPATPAAALGTKKHPNLPAIIGGVLGTLVALALLATLVFLVGRRRQLREKRRLTFHREWMVQNASGESIRGLNRNNSTAENANASDNGHAGPGSDGGYAAGPSRNASTSTTSSTAVLGKSHTANLLVPPSPFICVTPPPDDLETGLAKHTVASRAPKKLRLHTYTNDTDPTSPTVSSPTTAANTRIAMDAHGRMPVPLPAGAGAPVYSPSMLANSRNVVSSMTPNATPTQATTLAMPTPMRQTSTTPVTMGAGLARTSSVMGPRAPSPSPAAAAHGTVATKMDNETTTPSSPFPPQLPPLNLNLSSDDDTEMGRKPPASAPARSMTFPVKKTVTVRTEEVAVGRSATEKGKGKAKPQIINTIATRPASPRPQAGASSSTPIPLSAAANATPTLPSMSRKTPRQHLLAARLAILQNQMAEILSAPDSVHASMVISDMRRQVAWIAEHESGEWALGKTDERPAGWARVMTP